VITLRTYDMAGNTAEDQVLVLVDNTPPSISTPSISPEEPIEGVEIIIDVKVSDLVSGVERVILWYRVGAGKWTHVDMAFDGVFWIATIPKQGAYTQVKYYIEAYDRAGNMAKTDVYSFTVKAGVEEIAPVNYVLLYTSLAASIALSVCAILIALKYKRAKSA